MMKPKTNKKSKRTGHATGLLAEALAVWMLRLKGYRILAQRYKTRYGEVDIIARCKDALVFVEVKARRSKTEALEAVTRKMTQRIEKAALDYIKRHPAVQDCAPRFDVIAISLPFFYHHLDNAWRPAA